MAFVNEYVPVLDIKKYDVDNIMNMVHPRDKLPLYFKHKWTIDRDKKCFFIPVATGKEEFSNQHECAFFLDGHLFSVILNQHGHVDLAVKKGERVWELVRIEKLSKISLPITEIKELLKEALTVYGYRGVAEQLENLTVKFEF